MPTPISNSHSSTNFGVVSEARENARDQRVAASQARAANGQTQSLQDQSTVVNGGSKAQQPPAPGPSADAQSAAGSGSEGYATPPQDPVKKALEELKQDPEYTKLLSQIAFFEGIERGFHAIDAQFGGAFWSGLRDGKIDIGNIEAAARDSSSSGHEVAKKLLQSPELLSKLDRNSDGLYTKEELQAVLDELKSAKATMEKDARAAASPPAAPQAGGSTSAPPTGGEQTPPVTTAPTPGTEARNGEESEYQFKTADLEIRPFRSSATGTGELLADSMGHVQSEIERLTNLKAKALAAGKPEDAAKIDVQINKMNMCLQMVMSAMQQQQTMLSNIAKMWSDMAMTAIRNTH